VIECGWFWKLAKMTSRPQQHHGDSLVGRPWKNGSSKVPTTPTDRRARDIGREIGGHVEGHALHNLGCVFLRLHRIDEAIASFNEALRKHQAAGLLVGEAWTHKNLAEARAESGDAAGARASLTAAIRIFEQIGDQAGTAEATSLLMLLRT